MARKLILSWSISWSAPRRHFGQIGNWLWENLYLKPRLHRKANRMQTQYAKTMRTFDVDLFLREANSIPLCDERSANSWMLSVDCRYITGNSRTIHLCRVNSLPRQMPNNTNLPTWTYASFSHAAFVFAFRYKPAFKLRIHLHTNASNKPNEQRPHEQIERTNILHVCCIYCIQPIPRCLCHLSSFIFPL